MVKIVFKSFLLAKEKKDDSFCDNFNTAESIDQIFKSEQV